MLKGTEINTIKWDEEIMNKVPTRRPVHCHQGFSCRPIFQPVSTRVISRHFHHTALVHTLPGTQMLHRSLQLWPGSFGDWRVSYSSLWPLGHPEILTGCSDLGKTCWYAVILQVRHYVHLFCPSEHHHVASELPCILNLRPKSSLRKWFGVSIQK